MPPAQIPLDVERHRGRRRWPAFVCGLALGVFIGVALYWHARCA